MGMFQFCVSITIQLLMVPLLHNQHDPMRKQQEQRMVRERDNNIMIAYGNYIIYYVCTYI